MVYQVTARKWRPSRFAEVVGQEHITTTLRNALHSGRIAQCYLFSGPRGVGKTTTARILAKALNCGTTDEGDPCNGCPSCASIAAGTSMNVLEIDGASNNSVDDVRELRENVRYVPTEGQYKIYIVDEIHMLSTQAFNALLKTLEEPPPDVVFIFATTEVREVPQTILSRCQRFNFRRISAGKIAAHLGAISAAEGITADEEALYLLATRADGALRDAESLLDQVVSFDVSGVSVATAGRVLGLVSSDSYFSLTAAIFSSDARQVLVLVEELMESGVEVEEVVWGYSEHLRHLLAVKIYGDAKLLEVMEIDRDRYVKASARASEEDLLRMLQTVMSLETELRRSPQPRFRLELTLVRLARMGRSVEIGELLLRIEQLQPSLRDGGEVPVNPAPKVAGDSASLVEQASAAGSEGQPQLPSTMSSTAAGQSGGTATVGSPLSVEDRACTNEVLPTSPAPDFATIQREWEGLLQEVRQDQPAVAIFLGHARLMALVGRLLRLGFAPEEGFSMSQVNKNRDAIEQLCCRKWDFPLRLECVVEQGNSSAPERDTSGSVDPAVKSVLDAFDGELL